MTAEDATQLQAPSGEGFPREVRELFDGTNYVHVATVMPDGSPHSLPGWGIVEDDCILIGTSYPGDKAKNLHRDGRVSISVADRRDPNRILHIRGRVVHEVDADHGANEIMHQIAHAYIGRDHPAPGPDRVIFYIHADTVQYNELSMPFERVTLTRTRP
jgi:PPOX class probable F420-dependent enzyme